jgi:hypothetical protein
VEEYEPYSLGTLFIHIKKTPAPFYGCGGFYRLCLYLLQHRAAPCSYEHHHHDHANDDRAHKAPVC